MGYVIGFLAGAVWGVLGACLNHFILGRALRGGDRKVLGANLLRALVDLLLLAAVVLARNVLPFRYEMALAGTVSALGMMGIYFAFRTASGRDDKKEE
ncbi:MAG: hypothetical protein K6F56_05350 [Oscillospiraceae bacterium]|nr:hypothetical protein [Oscillospiraceae bacterium]